MAIWSILRTFGLFYIQPFGTILSHLVQFVVIWYGLWSFGTICGHLVHFFHFGMLRKEKSGNPDCINVLG
jgi:hypothetical protein